MVNNNTLPGTALDYIRQDGRIQCQHGHIITRKLCRTGSNAGKYFYSCFKDKKDPLNCKFFVWNDEVESKATNIVPEPGSPRWQLPDEQPPTYESTLPATPSVSRKRRRGDTPSTGDSRQNSGDRDSDADRNVMAGSSRVALPSPYSTHKRTKIEDNETSTPDSAYKPAHRAIAPVRDAEENPFVPLTPPSTSSTLFTQGSASRNTLKSSNEEQDFSDALQIIGTLLEDYKKVKRQKVAAEKARDVKADRMIQLEKQIAQLKELNESLQKQVEIYRGMLG